MKKNKTNLNALDHRIFTYWQALYLSFYSSRLYIDVGKRWKGLGLTYFLLVISLATIPLSIQSIQKFNTYYQNELLEPIKKMPDFSIRDGKLDFKYFMPYLIKTDTGKVSIIIDANINLTEANLLYPQWMLFITQDRLYIRLPHLSFIPEKFVQSNTDLHSKDIQMQSFAEIRDDAFSGAYWVEHSNLASTQRYMMLSIYPCVTLLLFGFFASFLLLLAILGKAISYTILKFKIDLKRAYRLMLVSSGCGISLFILSLSVGRIPGLGFYLTIVIVMYFFFAVLSLKRESKSLVLA